MYRVSYWKLLDNFSKFLLARWHTTCRLRVKAFLHGKSSEPAVLRLLQSKGMCVSRSYIWKHLEFRNFITCTIIGDCCTLTLEKCFPLKDKTLSHFRILLLFAYFLRIIIENICSKFQKVTVIILGTLERVIQKLATWKVDKIGLSFHKSQWEWA